MTFSDTNSKSINAADAENVTDACKYAHPQEPVPNARTEPKMKTLVFDIETNGLLHELDTILCLVTQDPGSGDINVYSDSLGHDSIAAGLRALSTADNLVGHNILGFDLLALNTVHGFQPRPEQKVFDTWIISQVMAYKRNHKHGLAGWGERFGFEKDEWGSTVDWPNAVVSQKMIDYCVRDVELNTKVWHQLLNEVNGLAETKPLIREGLRVEHDVARFNSMIKTRGWQFDMDKAQQHLNTLTKMMIDIEYCIVPVLPQIKTTIDKEPKTPKYTKAGWYTATTARMLSEYLGRRIIPEDAMSDNPPIQPGEFFQRIEIEDGNMGNMECVKDYLFSIGWEPDEYNHKPYFENGKKLWKRMGPKLTTTSLEKLGDTGRMIDEYYTLRSRRSVLEGWIALASKDGRLRGNMWTCGTPTFRCRHEVIANLPAVDAVFGRELRELFIAEPGYKVVGADSSGNQFRALCHYANDPNLTKQVLDGDIHQFNANIIGTDRRTAKSWIYAFLFGAGDAKLGKVLTNVSNKTIGKKSRDKYASQIPGLGDLITRVQHLVKHQGWLPGLDGRAIFVGSDFQALNYLLQAAEAVTCKAAVSYAMNKIQAEELNAYPALFYHDEQAWVVAAEDADRVKEILEESFREGPKSFGVTIMDGEGQIGQTYADVH